MLVLVSKALRKSCIHGTDFNNYRPPVIPVSCGHTVLLDHGEGL